MSILNRNFQGLSLVKKRTALGEFGDNWASIGNLSGSNLSWRNIAMSSDGSVVTALGYSEL